MQEKKNLPKLSVAEFEIMKVIWKKKTVAISTILNEINRTRLKKLNRSTIRVQITRLMEKGWITSGKQGKVLHYTATVPRGKASVLIADDVKERVFDGSFLDFVRALFQSSEISDSEISELRKLLKEHSEKEGVKWNT